MRLGRSGRQPTPLTCTTPSSPASFGRDRTWHQDQRNPGPSSPYHDRGTEYEIAGPDLNIVARWAGDSRAYVLDPAEGMQAVTKDDSEDGDALNSLANDQPMTNMICADRPSRINEFPLNTIRLPTVLLCATDGFITM